MIQMNAIVVFRADPTRTKAIYFSVETAGIGRLHFLFEDVYIATMFCVESYLLKCCGRRGEDMTQ